MFDKIHFLKIRANINDYLLLFICLCMIFGAIVYYIDAFHFYDLIIVLLLVIGSFYVISKKIIQNSLPSSELKTNWLIFNKDNYKYLLAYCIIYAFLITSLYFSKSDRPLISPWQVVKPEFFIAYALASFVLILSCANNKIKSGTKLFLISLHYFLSLLVAVIIYKIGYGFDPFIHQATMDLIDKKGLVTPKPPYYLGEYSLIIILHKISGLSVYFLNKILVPILTSLFLPLASYRFLKSFFINPGDSTTDYNNTPRFLSLIFILILTISPFIVTTPQNLSYLFLILTILNGLSQRNLFWVVILALATASIHPLTGLPALGWVCWLIFKKYQHLFNPVMAKITGVIIFSANSLILPIALFFAGGANFKKLNFDLSLLINPFNNILSGLSMSGREDWLSNSIYFFGANFNLFLLLIIFASLFFFYKQKNKPDWSSLVYINFSLIIAYILSSQILFNDLIGYEQNNYSGRLLIIICLFNLPFMIWAIEKIITKILSQNKIVLIIWLLFGVAMLNISLYISYPRFDKYFNSRGYSVSGNDIKAVKLINQQTNEPYTVLANQQVSAAALKEFGFNNYYQSSKGEIYFYPIPTGGPLYKYYLDMVYKKPDQKTAQGAMNLVGVKVAYLIVNKYWNDSGKIINEAKIEANSWFEVNGEVYIFKYILKTQ